VTVGMALTLGACSQWDPYNADRIGEAAKPGPIATNGNVVIVSRNIHGIYSNLMSCIRTRADVICIQEADIAESDAIDFHEQAAAAGYKCKWGRPTQLSKTSGGRDGRRVAMLVKHPTKVHILDDNEDDNTQYLRATGRWMECMIPVSDGRKQIIVACLYGISGSNNDNCKYEDNERLTAASLVRMDCYKDIAYYICTDINVDPQTSAVLTKAREAGIAYDIVNDYFEGNPAPTFKADGVEQHMTGKGVTRLDTIISNSVATHAVDTILYDYISGKGCDHVPLQLGLSTNKFNDEIDTPAMPAALNLRTLTGMTQAERNKTLAEEAEWFTTIWGHHNRAFEDAIRSKNVDEAHRIWCLAAEQFLWKCQRLGEGQVLPKHKPRRGQVMPTYKQQIAGQICDVTRMTRNAFTTKIDMALGLAHDLKMRIRRLVNGEENRDAATKEQLKEQWEHVISIKAHEVQGEVEGTSSSPNEYDTSTAGKTLWRLASAARKIRDSIDKYIPKRTSNVKYVQKEKRQL